MSLQRAWNLDRSVWERLDLVAPADKWRNVPFTEFHQETVPAAQGVYAFAGGPDSRILDGGLYSKLFNVVYVGSAKNLRSRFRQHLRGDRPQMKQALNAFPALTFFYLKTPETKPQYVEQVLIDALGPPANQIRAVAVAKLPPLSAKLGEARPAQGRDQ